jgi:hypothetical protein
MIIHLDSDSVPIHFVQIEHIIGEQLPICQNYLHQINYEGILDGTSNPKVNIHTNQ